MYVVLQFAFKNNVIKTSAKCIDYWRKEDDIMAKLVNYKK